MTTPYVTMTAERSQKAIRKEGTKITVDEIKIKKEGPEVWLFGMELFGVVAWDNSNPHYQGHLSPPRAHSQACLNSSVAQPSPLWIPL